MLEEKLAVGLEESMKRRRTGGADRESANWSLGAETIATGLRKSAGSWAQCAGERSHCDDFVMVFKGGRQKLAEVEI